jgi:hypothetical protein
MPDQHGDRCDTARAGSPDQRASQVVVTGFDEPFNFGNVASGGGVFEQRTWLCPAAGEQNGQESNSGEGPLQDSRILQVLFVVKLNDGGVLPRKLQERNPLDCV